LSTIVRRSLRAPRRPGASRRSFAVAQALSEHRVRQRWRAVRVEHDADLVPRLAEFIEVGTLLDDLARLEGKGLKGGRPTAVGKLRPEAIQRYGERLRHQTATGAHRMGVGGLLTTTTATGPRVRPHTFYCQHPHPRG
jgi:hypothetical protein